jgi:hypothetical protein
LVQIAACGGARNVPIEPTATPALLTALAVPRVKLGSSGRSIRPADVQYAGRRSMPGCVDPTAADVETPLADEDAPAGVGRAVIVYCDTAAVAGTTDRNSDALTLASKRYVFMS